MHEKAEIRSWHSNFQMFEATKIALPLPGGRLEDEGAMRSIKPKDVFKPGGLPSVTYVSRDHLRLEEQMRHGLERDHSFTVVSGPSKTGKTVLSKRILGEDCILTVHGGAIRTIDEFWSHVSYKLSLPSSASKASTKGWSLGNIFEGGFSFPHMFSGKASISAGKTGQKSLTANYVNIPVIASIKMLQDRSISLVIEDFHYLDSDVQQSVLRSLKNAVSEGLKVVVLAAPHRTFDPVDVEGELAGRVEHVQLPNWALDDLSEIASLGFKQLGLVVPSNIQTRICEDSFGNPLLAQDICLRVAEAMLDQKEKSELGSIELGQVYDAIVQARGIQRFQRLAAARSPGGGMVQVTLKSGATELLPAAILSAVARLGPNATTGIDEIADTLEAIADAATPYDEIVAALTDLAAAGSVGGSPSLEWRAADRQLVITDPYLLFHLKWQIRDRRTMRLPARTVARIHDGTVADMKDPAEGKK